MQDSPPDRFLISKRHGRPLCQNLYNILREHATAHLAVQQPLQMLPLDPIIGLQKLSALCTVCAFYDLEQIRCLNAILSGIPAAMRVPCLHPL